MDARVRRTLRGALFAVLAGTILLAPSARQVFGVKHPYLRSWTMFSGFGLQICEAEFRGAGGSGAPLDRYAALGVSRDEAPSWLRKMRNEDDVRGVARKLCTKLGQDVRVSARCAARSGWKTVLEPSTQVCGGRAVTADDVSASPEDDTVERVE